MKTTRTFFSSMLLLTASWMMPAKAQDVSTGKKLIETNQWNKANKLLIDLVKKNPTDATAKFYLAETYFALGQKDSAESNYTRGAAENADFAFNQAGLGKIILGKGDTLKAKEAFNKALKSDKKNGDLYAYVADACVSNNFPKIAEQYIARGKEVTTKNPRIHLAEGNLWFLKGNAGEAANAYERAYFYDKNLPLAYVKVGMIYTDARSFEVATTNFNKALELDPQYPLAFKGLGDMYYKASKFKDASDNYKKYFAASEITIEDQYRFTFILFYNKEYAEATKMIADLLVRDPKNPVLARIKAYISYELSVDEKGSVKNKESAKSAMEYINQFFNVQSQKGGKFLSSDYEYLAKIQIANNLDSLAPSNYKKAFELDSTKFNFLEDAAKTYIKLTQFVDAANCYNTLLKVSSENAAINSFQAGKMYYFQATKKDTAKADSLVKRGNLILADSAFKKVATLSPNSYLGSLWMARAESQLDAVAQEGLANTSYEKLIQLIVTANEQAKRKNELMEAYNYFGSFYYVKAYKAKVKKSLTEFQDLKTKSMEFWSKMQEINPEDAKAKAGVDAVKELDKIK